MYKVIVAGSRDFSNYALLESKLLEFLAGRDLSEIEIVSGGARGADKLGERFAKERGCGLSIFTPDWDGIGKSAGFRRNAEMADYANAAVCFWDGSSKGTKHMADTAKKKGLDYLVVPV